MLTFLLIGTIHTFPDAHQTDLLLSEVMADINFYSQLSIRVYKLGLKRIHRFLKALDDIRRHWNLEGIRRY